MTTRPAGPASPQAILLLEQTPQTAALKAGQHQTQNGTDELPQFLTELIPQQAAEAAERWLDSLDPAAIASPDADASRLRRIGDAVRAVARSQVELADAVAEARVHGHTWTQIATMLGTSRQAAQERYGEPAERR